MSDFRRRANSIDFKARWALWAISQGLVLNYLISASKTLPGAGKLQERLEKLKARAPGQAQGTQGYLGWVLSSPEQQRTLGKGDWAGISPTPVSHQIPTVPHVREGTTEGHLSQHSLQILSALLSPTFSSNTLFLVPASTSTLSTQHSLPSFLHIADALPSPIAFVLGSKRSKPRVSQYYRSDLSRA